MCGRFTQRSSLNVVAAQFQAQLPFPEEWPAPRYNIAPTLPVAIVRRLPGEAERQLAIVRWGLIPSWAKDPKIGGSTFNARAETAAEKPSFRAAFKRRRCLIVSDGFYEWQKIGKAKQPYLIRRSDEASFAFAGLWESWHGAGPHSPRPGTPGRGVGGEGHSSPHAGTPARREGIGVEESVRPLETCTILTTSANDLMRPLHDRMPVILHPVDYELWLDPEVSDRERIEPLMVPYEGDDFVASPFMQRIDQLDKTAGV